VSSHGTKKLGFRLTATAGIGLLWSVALCPCAGGEISPWQVVKSKHFLVCHTNEERFARQVAERAEACYDAMATDLGYTRYQDFWLWDKRVRILIYPTEAAFTAACSAPSWAIGRASTKRREIAGYREDGDGFLRNVLPHEMAHLILNAFVGEDRVPLWLGEGFAQWEALGHERQSRDGRGSVGKPIPFSTWASLDIRRERNPGFAAAYYAQSASVVGFLIESYGGTCFGQFCRALRDGKAFELALADAYPGALTNVTKLEAAWLEWTKGGRE
jgi:hypothetical protein